MRYISVCGPNGYGLFQPLWSQSLAILVTNGYGVLKSILVLNQACFSEEAPFSSLSIRLSAKEVINKVGEITEFGHKQGQVGSGCTPPPNFAGCILTPQLQRLCLRSNTPFTPTEHVKKKNTQTDRLNFTYGSTWVHSLHQT